MSNLGISDWGRGYIGIGDIVFLVKVGSQVKAMWYRQWTIFEHSWFAKLAGKWPNQLIKFVYS